MLIPVLNYENFCSASPSFRLSVCKHEAFLSSHAQESSKKRLGIMLSRAKQSGFSNSQQAEFHQHLSTQEMLATHFFQQWLLQKVFCSSRTTKCPLHRCRNSRTSPKVTSGKDPQRVYVLKQGCNKGFQETKLRKGMHPEEDSFNKERSTSFIPRRQQKRWTDQDTSITNLHQKNS